VGGAGVVQNHIKYDSFGNVTAQSNSAARSRFGFTGREFDSETGLYYYRARYYDSVVGRFISEDPISFAGGDANLSRYIGNSPMNGTDPYGLKVEQLLRPLAPKPIPVTPTGGGLLAPILAGFGAFLGTLLAFPQPVADATMKRTIGGLLNQLSNDTQKSAKDETGCQEEDKKKTCMTKYPKYIPCDALPRRYIPKFRQNEDAGLYVVNYAFMNSYPDSGPEALKGPCGTGLEENQDQYIYGRHYNVYRSSNLTGYMGSVGECPCCIENGGNPKIISAGAVLSPEKH
jgi:RHS repeat-associated protein